MALPLSSVNHDASAIDSVPASFDLNAKPDTDIYAAPSHGYHFTAPIIYHSFPASDFQRARVTVSMNWEYQYDQGGLILVFPSPENSLPDGQSANHLRGHPRWVKSGVEINDDRVWISVVGRETWADWSLSTPPPACQSDGPSKVKATIEFEKHDNALKVYVLEGEKKLLIREIQWVFLDEQAKGICWLGVYAARPDAKREAKGDLSIHFDDFVVEA
jgi:regulation of enolase protein 1 (concanavalin A-like superfamily)